MGYSVSAVVVVGVKVPHSRLFEERKLRGCKHPKSSNAHCGKCGAPTWTTAKIEIEGYTGTAYKGMEVWDVSMDNPAYTVIGKKVAEVHTYVRTDSDRAIPIPMEKIREAMSCKTILDEPVGIWLVLQEEY
jgi:hypothetical protein